MIEELKETLLESGNPFVWINERGWFFNEQPDSIRYTAAQILAADSLENIPDAEVQESSEETEFVVTKKRGGKK